MYVWLTNSIRIKCKSLFFGSKSKKYFHKKGYRFKHNSKFKNIYITLNSYHLGSSSKLASFNGKAIMPMKFSRSNLLGQNQQKMKINKINHSICIKNLVSSGDKVS